MESFRAVHSGTLKNSAKPAKVCNDFAARHAVEPLPKQAGRSSIASCLGSKRTAEHEILETLALLAEGSRISSLMRAKGFKEDTLLAWLRQAAQHAEALDEVLMKDFKVKRGQLDALWSYVQNKGEKKATQRRK